MSHESKSQMPMDDADVALVTNTAQRTSSLLLSLAIVLNIFVLAMIFTSRIRFRHVLEDFGITASPITSFVLGNVFPAILVLVLVATVAKEFAAALPKLKNRWNVVAIAVTLACLFVYGIGIFTPLVRLIESLS